MPLRARRSADLAASALPDTFLLSPGRLAKHARICAFADHACWAVQVKTAAFQILIRRKIPDYLT